ncbi:MAG: hypothetical protein ACLGI6_08165 [Gammaproteobacteria bacterium]
MAHSTNSTYVATAPSALRQKLRAFFTELRRAIEQASRTYDAGHTPL